MRRAAWAALAALAAAPPAGHAGEPARRVSFLQAVEIALTGNPEVKIAAEGVAASGARVDGAKAQRLPRLRLESNVFVWDDELTFSLDGFPLPPGTELPAVREQVTSTTSVTVAQPLSGLILLSRLVGMERAGAAVARADYDRARLDVAYRAAEGYLRVLQATALRDVARRSVEQIEAHLARARVLERGGMLGQVDLLRLEAARDGARQGLIRAEGALRTAARALVLTLGLPEGTAIEVYDDLPEPPPRPRWTEDEAVALALANRPELRGARRRVEQAEKGRQVAESLLYPNVAAVATYQHTEGGGTIQPEDAWFVGLTLQWDVWDWGKNRAGEREAKHRREQARLAHGGLVDQVAFDVRRRVVDAQTAWETLEAARSGLKAAEEAYRIQSVRFEGGAATTTDVLDAETEVQRARAAYALARYDYFIALVALARGVGEVPREIR